MSTSGVLCPDTVSDGNMSTLYAFGCPSLSLAPGSMFTPVMAPLVTLALVSMNSVTGTLTVQLALLSKLTSLMLQALPLSVT
jgi:hypothetical protein